MRSGLMAIALAAALSPAAASAVTFSEAADLSDTASVAEFSLELGLNTFSGTLGRGDVADAFRATLDPSLRVDEIGYTLFSGVSAAPSTPLDGLGPFGPGPFDFVFQFNPLACGFNPNGPSPACTGTWRANVSVSAIPLPTGVALLAAAFAVWGGLQARRHVPDA